MPRKLRCIEPGAIYHCIPRFVAQEWFVESHVERRTYLTWFGLGIASSDWRCFAFAVMSNHIHLALVAGYEPLGSWLRPVHTDFAQWINERRQRIGAVFTRGPNMIHVMPAGAGRLVSYIHRNPVRAGVVSDPDASDWTSHRAYAGTGARPTWLDVATGLRLGGFSSGGELAAWINANATTRKELDAFRSKRGPTPVLQNGAVDD